MGHPLFVREAKTQKPRVGHPPPCYTLLKLKMNLSILKVEVRLMCEKCERLDETFIAVRARISDIDWGFAPDSQLEQLEQANLLVLGEIMDHQIHCI